MLVELPERAQLSLPRCQSCRERGALTDTFVVHSGQGMAALDGAAVVARLRAGQLSGEDWILPEQGDPMPVAAHPAFAPLFARGEFGDAKRNPVLESPRIAAARVAETVSTVSPPAPRRAWLYVAAGAVLLGGATALAIGVGLDGDAPPAAPPEVAAPAPVPVPVKGDDEVSALVARIGVVEEPAALLRAQALAEWARGTAAGEKAAAEFAARAVARYPADADALALLGWLTPGEAARPFAEAAVAAGEGRAASRIGKATLALRAGEEADAAAELSTCSTAGEAVCGHFLASLAVGADAAALRDADTSLAAWPSLVRTQVVAARLAVELDAPDALARLERLPSDSHASVAAGLRGTLALRDGDLAEAEAQARRAGADAASELRLGLARAALEAGDTKSAQAWLPPAPAEGAPEESHDFGLLRAQVALRQAESDPSALPAAVAAVERLLARGRTDPATAQVRALLARLQGTGAGAEKFWSSMDETRRSGAELARVLRTALDFERAAGASLVDQVARAESAIAADPAHPDGYVWLAAIHFSANDARLAVDALRAGVAGVDGQVVRRRPGQATLATPAPAKELIEAVERALAADVSTAGTLPFARAAAAWLAGDATAALAALSGHRALAADPEALAVRARIRAAAGDHAGSLADWKEVLTQDPSNAAAALAASAELAELGKIKSSAQWMSAVEGSKIQSPLRYFIAAELREAKGDRSGAVQQLEIAISRDPLDYRARLRLRELQRGP